MVLEDYVERMNKKDAKGISELFAVDAKFSDGGGRPFGYPDINLEGREAILNLFSGILNDNNVVAKIVKLNPASMEYDVDFSGTIMPCVGMVTVDDDGLIKEYIVRPR